MALLATHAHERFKVAVLMGGPSEEHAISLKSGEGVTAALRRRQWPVEPVVIPKTLSVRAAGDFVRRALKHAGAEAAFIALHGTFGEDGTIQQLCEDLHLAYTGSDAKASRLGMDKIASRRRFEETGLPVPRWRAIDCAAGERPSRVDGLAFPLVVKPACQGSSLGVSIVRRPNALVEAVTAAARYDAQVIVEEWVDGRELTVGILGEHALPVIEIRAPNGFFDFTAKYTPGATEYLVPAPLPPEVAQLVQTIGLMAHRAVGCRHLSRADLILSKERVPVLLEVNTIPGFTPTSLLPKSAACVGVSYDELCEQLVLMAHAPAAVGAARQDNPYLVRA